MGIYLILQCRSKYQVMFFPTGTEEHEKKLLYLSERLILNSEKKCDGKKLALQAVKVYSKAIVLG